MEGNYIVLIWVEVDCLALRGNPRQDYSPVVEDDRDGVALRRIALEGITL